MSKLAFAVFLSLLIGITIGLSIPYGLTIYENHIAPEQAEKEITQDGLNVEENTVEPSVFESPIALSPTSSLTELPPLGTSYDVNQLVKENNALKIALERQKVSLKNYVALRMELSEANTLLEQNNIEREDQVSTDLEEIEPKEFAPFVETSVDVEEKIKIMQDQPESDDWAFLKEQQINDFFITHERSTQLNLRSVKCKSASCEVQGFELDEDSFSTVMDDIMTQPWWSFRSSISTSRISGKQGKFFYLIVSETS